MAPLQSYGRVLDLWDGVTVGHGRRCCYNCSLEIESPSNGMVLLSCFGSGHRRRSDDEDDRAIVFAVDGGGVDRNWTVGADTAVAVLVVAAVVVLVVVDAEKHKFPPFPRAWAM